MKNYEYEFSPEQRAKALRWLIFWHMIIIVSSNYFVQFPISFMGVDNTWGAFTYPFIFLTTDMTVRIFGRSLARKIIFCVMFPALLISYLVTVLFHDGVYQGLAALHQSNVIGFRIALASFSAYIFGQLLDISVFNRLRQLSSWWVAPVASSVLGAACDTLVFFSVAFYRGPDAFMAEHWFNIGLADYATKLVISGLFFLPAYGVILKVLTDKLLRLHRAKAMVVNSI